MFPEKEWAAACSGQSKVHSAIGAGMVRLALLFGTVALALVFFVAPLSTTGPNVAELNGAMTASFIGQNEARLLHRDGLGQSAASICVFRENGTRSGNC